MTTETTTCEECANMRAFGFVAAEVDADHERGHPDWCADQVSAAPSATNDGWFDRVSGSLKGELGTDDEFLAATAETSFHQVVPGTERAAHSASHKCVRCQRTAAETGATHILNGTCAGWACFPECPPAAPSPSAPEVEGMTAKDVRTFEAFVSGYASEWKDGEWGWETAFLHRVLAALPSYAALSDSLRVARKEAAKRDEVIRILTLTLNRLSDWQASVVAALRLEEGDADDAVPVIAAMWEKGTQLAALRRTQEEDTRAIIVGEVCEDCAAHVRACCPDALAARTTAPTGEEAP